MNNTILLFIFVIFLSSTLFSSSITRGPEVGEIYYIGPTVTGEGIYRSTDFGQTATCMDSTLNTNISFMSICADLTSGVLYGFSMPENLYISYDYGEEGSWQFRDTAHWDILSGRNEGEIYDSLVKHSIDYGLNFSSHSMNGFFGSRLMTEIDNQDECGYIVVSQYGIPDSLWLLITYDNFNNINIQNSYNDNEFNLSDLSKGVETGELYSLADTPQTIHYSNNYGNTWETKNSFTCPNLPIKGIVGGRQPGEIFMLVEYVQLMHEIQHTYIYHSTDYGETFTIYNPFSFGPEPYFANFTATPTEGEAPLTVQFTDISSGENNQDWQWDFDGDDVIDSYEQNPEYTYQESGIFQASLTIFWTGQPEMTATQEINVSDSVSASNDELIINDCILNNYPNPFNPETTIHYTLPVVSIEESNLLIYNIKGQLIETLTIDNTRSSLNWKPKQCSSGIYFYKLNIKNSPIKKMLLLK